MKGVCVKDKGRELDINRQSLLWYSKFFVDGPLNHS